MKKKAETSRVRRVPWGLFACLILLFCSVGCNRSDAPWCLMRAGEWTTDTMSFAAPLDFALTLDDHLEVECVVGDSNVVELIWRGPENLIAHASAVWVGSELVLNHEDRCQWARDLSHVVAVQISAPKFSQVELNGQGTFNLVHLKAADHVTVNAQDYAGAIDLLLAVDSATVKLQNGAAQATVAGSVHEFQGFSSGLSSLDASACVANYAYIRQSGVGNLRFSATDYAYVAIDAPGNVLGGHEPPIEWQLNRTGSGQLLWEH